MLVGGEDVVGAAPTGDAPTTYELSRSLLPAKVWLILDALRYGSETRGYDGTNIAYFRLGLVWIIASHTFMWNVISYPWLKHTKHTQVI